MGITDDTYTKRQVLRMEHLVLKVLEFELGSPTMHLFASKMSAMAGSCERTTSLAMYLVELALMNADFLNWRASMVAAAAVALSDTLWDIRRGRREWKRAADTPWL